MKESFNLATDKPHLRVIVFLLSAISNPQAY